MDRFQERKHKAKHEDVVELKREKKEVTVAWNLFFCFLLNLLLHYEIGCDCCCYKWWTSNIYNTSYYFISSSHGNAFDDKSPSR